MLERKVATKAAIGTAKGAGVGWAGGEIISSVTNKVAGVEKWFDNTKVGKTIDHSITKAENWLHKAIGGGSY